MGIYWGRNLDETYESKLDRAITAGFEPGEDYDQPPAAWIEADFQASGYATKAEWFAAGVEHSRLCGDHSTRCDTCGERLCAIDGPEPRACGVTCADCPCDCTACQLAREDLRAELLHQIERDSR